MKTYKFFVEKDGKQTEVRVNYGNKDAIDSKRVLGLDMEEEIALHIGREILSTIRSMEEKEEK